MGGETEKRAGEGTTGGYVLFAAMLDTGRIQQLSLAWTARRRSLWPLLSTVPRTIEATYNGTPVR